MRKSMSSYIITKNINVRELPSKNARVLVKLTAGSRINKIENYSNGWTKISFNQSGYQIFGFVWTELIR